MEKTISSEWNRTFRHRPNAQANKRRRLRLAMEPLERRDLLAGDAWQWFQSFDDVPRIAPAELQTEQQHAADVIGPRELVASEWIVQLTDQASRSADSLMTIGESLDSDPVDFTVITGLGSPGSVLLRGTGVTKADIREALSISDEVTSLHENALIEGQRLPNESDYISGQLSGMNLVIGPDSSDPENDNAWGTSIGSTKTVVGVVDTGIDPTHPDLFLNIWLNQGEIPATFLDEDGPKLEDIDGDGLITFYDLNHATRSETAPFELTVAGFDNGPNAEFVNDLNGNGRIDAMDLLDDANWADGFDTDDNGFFDDFFGVNFRVGADDPFLENNPSDELGHGTHVAGTIGAIGNNDLGVVGVNWQTSLMSLRILDNNNQGDSGAAIRAVNYARMMRERLTTNGNNRVTAGANVKVLNNSWGQPGGFEVSLEAAIADSSEAGILFVAAAGNGNILGNGVDNDRTPFYPASYEAANVIAVAASDGDDQLASFSNFGDQSVDLLAPGVGIRSTVPGGGYQSANGTSMATPHVAGTAALIWSAFPSASVAEVREAILSTARPVDGGNQIVSTGGRLNASDAIDADVFAPAARLVAKQDITNSGGTSTEFTVSYSHRNGIDENTIGDDDLIVTRQWGPANQLPATLKAGSAIRSVDGISVTVMYTVDAPGESGTWDALDFGEYVISTVAGSVLSDPQANVQAIESRDIGSFDVRIDDDPSVLYVDSNSDSLESGSLRSAIIEANAANEPRTIILDTGTYTIDLPAVVDPDSTFGGSLDALGIHNPGGWSDATTGDFDVEGNVTIVGDTNDETVIDARGLDRAIKVERSASLGLSRLTVQGGVAPASQGGGGILSLGNLDLQKVTVRKNVAFGDEPTRPAFGGAIAAWAGKALISESWLTENAADFGGGMYYGGEADGVLQRSTLSHNQGGGLWSNSLSDLFVANSTFSANEGGFGAIANGEIFASRTADSASPSLSADGRYVTFLSKASNLVPGDTNEKTDVFVYDRSTGTMQRANVDNEGLEANSDSSSPSQSADGRYVTFGSGADNLIPGGVDGSGAIFTYDRITETVELIANNSLDSSISADGRYVTFRSNRALVPGDSNGQFDIFVYDRIEKVTERISDSDAGVQGNGKSSLPSLSADGRFVTFVSEANNLVPGDTNDRTDVFVYDRVEEALELVSFSRVEADGTRVVGNNTSTAPSISSDGRFVAFDSDATDLVPGDNDTNGRRDVYILDRETEVMQRLIVDSSDPGSRFPSLSGDGRYVAFESLAEIVIYDRVDQTFESVRNEGIKGNNSSLFPSFSADGRFVTFVSEASNLAPGDHNVNDGADDDIFVYDRIEKTIEPITYRSPKSVINVSNSTVAFSTTEITTFTVSGNVQVHDSLFVSNRAVADLDVIAAAISSENVLSETPNSERIGPLQRLGNSPPVHPLILGNPAIGSEETSSDGSLDQLGQTRIFADKGAVEAVTASVSGNVYVDSNQNGRLDVNEPGLLDAQIVINGSVRTTGTSGEGNPPGRLIRDASEFVFSGASPGRYVFSVKAGDEWTDYTPPLEMLRRQSIIGNESSRSPALSADGRFVVIDSTASNFVPGDENSKSDIFVFDRVAQTVERVSISGEIRADGTMVGGNNHSYTPSISDDGRYVAYMSDANNLVPGDEQFTSDIFVYDRVEQVTERVSLTGEVRADGTRVGGDGDSFLPSLSGDGRFVTFKSSSSNLISEENNPEDIYVYDRIEQKIERVSNNIGNDVPDDPSDEFTRNGYRGAKPSISADGRYVAFESEVSNLVPRDENLKSDIFVFDRFSQTIERVSRNGEVRPDGTAVGGNDASFTPSISDDGRYVAFMSLASDLTEDVNGTSDIFVYDRLEQTTEIVSLTSNGDPAPGASREPSISGSGRFVAFKSRANLAPEPGTNLEDIFVYDRTKKVIALLSISDDGVQANGEAANATLSADGRHVSYSSAANNLVPGDLNNFYDVFVAFNPLAEAGTTLTLQAGEFFTDLNLGLVPRPGTIRGRVFEDVVKNGFYDEGEPVDVAATVFLDLDGNRTFDEGEPFTTPNAEGIYEFSEIDAFRSYTIVAQAPIGFEQISPGASEDFVWSVLLPAGGTVIDRDFALRRINSTGQSSASAVSGRLYVDKNDNGTFDAGDEPLAGREVYLDATNFGVRDSNEPRKVTDSEGKYLIENLSSRTVAVTTSLDETFVHVTPQGSDFALQKLPLFPEITPFGNPQAIAAGDFNTDGFQDVAVALGEGNRLSIRLNDQDGGFLPDQINFDLGIDGSGPTSLVVGQFDDDSKLDVALTANFAGNVTVLLNFDPVTKTFASTTYVEVGNEPLDIAAGQFDGDAKLDLVVVNKADNTVQLLTNNGSGVFTATTAVPSGGENSSSIVVGQFSDDAFDDVAVVHASPKDTTSPSGGVTVLAGNGAGGLTLQTPYYEVGAGPIDSVSADFNQDGLADLAVANFLSNSISVLLGQANEPFRVQAAILGTASGAFDIAVGDVDNDGDIDVFASNLNDRNISIFRNDGPDPTTGDVSFQPLENIGLGQFSLAQRMPLVVANFDEDTSEPDDGSRTLDVVTIPALTDTLHLLTNTLVDGARRVELTGLNQVENIDFIIAPANLPPSFDPVIDPTPIVEDSLTQTISLSGILAGRSGGDLLELSVISKHEGLIPTPTASQINPGNGGAPATATLAYVPVANQSGNAVIEVTLTDAGADGKLAAPFDLDNTSLTRTFTVSVLPVNDPPTFDVPDSISGAEDSGEQTIAVTNITPGGGDDESDQILDDFLVTTSDDSLFAANGKPTISFDRATGVGSLVFTPADDRAGTVTVTLTLRDDGGAASGGDDTTVLSTVINVLSINDRPSITLIADTNQSVGEGADLQTVTSFASGFDPGGGVDETTQSVSDFVVSVDDESLFSVLPDIDNNGNLTYQPAAVGHGIANVSVQARDSGGTARCEAPPAIPCDLSEPLSFTISVNDTTAPAPTLATIGPSTTQPPDFAVEVDFGEEVVGFDSGDVTIREGTGTIAGVTDRGNGRFLVLVNDAAEGAFTLSLGVVVTDLAQNPNVAAADLELTIEEGAPGAIILEGSDNTFFLTQPNLDGVQLIDIRGTGDNTLMLDADRISTTFAGGEILVVSDSGDEVVFDDGWKFEIAFASGEQLVRQFTHAGAVLNLIGPDDFTNPIDVFDINGSGNVSAVDAIQVINELGRRSFSDDQSTPRGAFRDLDAINLDDYRFFDVTRDGRVSALDVVQVINQLSRLASGTGLGESIVAAVESPAVEDRPTDLPLDVGLSIAEPSGKLLDSPEAFDETPRSIIDSQPSTTDVEDRSSVELHDMALQTLSYE